MSRYTDQRCTFIEYTLRLSVQFIVVCKLLDLGHAGLGHAELGQRDWDMRNWDSGTGTGATRTAGLGQALQGHFVLFFVI